MVTMGLDHLGSQTVWTLLGQVCPFNPLRVKLLEGDVRTAHAREMPYSGRNPAPPKNPWNESTPP